MLIPLFVWLYVVKRKYGLAAITLFVSGLTDVADGYIARRFGMISDLGKIIDPIADKLTQMAAAVCLAFRYRLMIVLLMLMVLKEIYLSLFGWHVIRATGKVHSSKWFGKLCTVYLYCAVLALILLPEMPKGAADTIIIVGCGMAIMVAVLYSIYYFSLIAENRKVE
ncbi:MAG: CDP-alcohol phosphatidyltransferase family protein [Oscillospiraceae bacterium]|nr:CDP-alcohol phosphatidyltransferase family protein [Oscillospiraceae bacterium]